MSGYALSEQNVSLVCFVAITISQFLSICFSYFGFGIWIYAMIFVNKKNYIIIMGYVLGSKREIHAFYTNKRSNDSDCNPSF